MKEVTFKGTKSGGDVSGVMVGDNDFPLDVPVVVANHVVSDLDLPANADYKFSIKETTEASGSRSPEGKI